MRKLTSLVLVAVLALFAVACSDDDGGSKEASSSTTASDGTTTTKPDATTSSTTPDLDPDEVDADASPYCAAWADLRASGPTEGMDAAALKDHYGKLVPIAQRLTDAAEPDAKADAQKALDLTKEVAASGSVEPFNRPESKELQQRLATYAQGHCAA